MPKQWRGMMPDGTPATPWFDILPEDATEEETQAQIKKQREQYEEWHKDD